MSDLKFNMEDFFNSLGSYKTEDNKYEYTILKKFHNELLKSFTPLKELIEQIDSDFILLYKELPAIWSFKVPSYFNNNDSIKVGYFGSKYNVNELICLVKNVIDEKNKIQSKDKVQINHEILKSVKDKIKTLSDNYKQFLIEINTIFNDNGNGNGKYEYQSNMENGVDLNMQTLVRKSTISFMLNDLPEINDKYGHMSMMDDIIAGFNKNLNEINSITQQDEIKTQQDESNLDCNIKFKNEKKIIPIINKIVNYYEKNKYGKDKNYIFDNNQLYYKPVILMPDQFNNTIGFKNTPIVYFIMRILMDSCIFDDSNYESLTYDQYKKKYKKKDLGVRAHDFFEFGINVYHNNYGGNKTRKQKRNGKKVKNTRKKKYKKKRTRRVRKK